MLTNVPLLIVPFIVYNVVGLGLLGDGSSDPWAAEVMSLSMISGAVWSMTLGDLMITLGLFLLFFEIIKATRVGASSIVDHLLSTFVLIAFLVEFLIVGFAAHAVFFILMVIALVDVVAGFSISIRSATRDVAIGQGF
ncbi:MAG: hypothetical protein L3J32_13100 [Rhizobiaceae bacterium]|nr:hypothetical protein [Rhizobiaceae bacterium]